MTDYPRYASLRRSLAAWLWLTTLVVWSAGAPARGETATGEAVRLYAEGRGLTARAGLVALLETPPMREPAARLPVLQTLLDICIHSRAEACVARYGPDYAEAAGQALPEAPVLRAEQARRAAYYFDEARLALHRPEVTAQILDWAPPAIPPKHGQGYDLARADWVVRHHAVSYAGSAAGFRSARLLTGAAATERGFRGELVGAYRYLSFATHGLMRGELSGLTEPALVLTPGSGEPGDDGLLTASEIADLNLAAAFVALSACNTANFDLRAAAEDLPALASAFAVAGAPATLATLWPVNSQAGEQVVAATFARLGEAPQVGPGEALTEAQRAFLAAPPGRAWLHPRFWAPFVVLGDGGARGPALAPALSVTAVEPMAEGPGEGLAVLRAGGGVAARYLGAAAGAGRRTTGLRMTDANGVELWRNEAESSGASVFLGALGAAIVTGGAERGADGRLDPHLDLAEVRTGAAAGSWTAPTSGAAVAGVLNGAALGHGRALVVTGDIRRRDGRPPVAQVYELSAGAPPRRLFETHAGRLGLDAAAVAPLGDDVLVSLTDRQAPPAQAPGAPADDYDAPACLWETVTRIELRDRRTGALKASREIRGLDVTAALSRGKAALLAGAETPACGGERRAVVLRIGPDLNPQTLYRDDSLGESWAWSLSAMPGGRVFVAASKRAVVDVRPVAASPEAAVAAVAGLPTGTSGMALVLEAHGVASSPRLLEAGADVFVNGADASRPDDILLAGGLGGRPVIFHLRAAGP